MRRIVSADALMKETILHSQAEGDVHSVFAHAVNLRFACLAPDLCTLVSSGGDLGPGVFQCDLDSFSEVDIREGDHVHVMGGIVYVGNAAFDGSRCREWTPQRISYPQNTDWARASVARLLPRVAPGGRSAQEARQSLQGADLRTLLEQRTQALVDALRKGRMEDARTGAAALLGLGVGLTPSGDDILLGMAAALTMEGGPSAHLEKFWRFVASIAPDKTNAISATGIRAATRGKMRRTVADFIDALAGEGAHDLESAFRAILAIGSSSGADMAYGILNGFTLMFLLEKKITDR